MPAKKASLQRYKKLSSRKLVLRALTDRKFRTALQKTPAKALGKRLTAVEQREIAFVLATVKGIERQISAIGDELLCVGTIT